MFKRFAGRDARGPQWRNSRGATSSLDAANTSKEMRKADDFLQGQYDLYAQWHRGQNKHDPEFQRLAEDVGYADTALAPLMTREEFAEQMGF